MLLVPPAALKNNMISPYFLRAGLNYSCETSKNQHLKASHYLNGSAQTPVFWPNLSQKGL